MVFQADKFSSIQLAVFPLPGMVAFEGQQHLLHIFEPRYRKMVDDCVEQNRPLGLALPRKRISTVDNSGKSFQEILNSNQNTYQAHQIFGAGTVRILRTMPDGRILVTVNVLCRVKMRALIQSLPYFLAEVDVINLEPMNPQLAKAYCESLMAASRSILKDKYTLFVEKIPDLILKNYDLQALMLKILDWFRLDSEMLQLLLEDQSLEKRAARFMDYMQVYLQQEDTDGFIEFDRPKPASTEESSGKLIEIDFNYRQPDDDPDSSNR